MQLSFILLGVIIILANFMLSSKTYKKMGTDLKTINLISLLVMLFLIVKPVNLYDTVFISIGGFLLIGLITVFWLINLKEKNELYTVSLGIITLIGFSFFLNLLLPYEAQEAPLIYVVIAGISLGIITASLVKNLKTAFIIIFSWAPLASIIYFVINKVNGASTSLFLGTGNFFEAGILAFTTVFLISIIYNAFIAGKYRYKKQDILIFKSEDINFKKENIL